MGAKKNGMEPQINADTRRSLNEKMVD